jgi:UDP-glucose 4-epimerase
LRPQHPVAGFCLTHKAESPTVCPQKRDFLSPIGDNHEISILELAENIRSLTQSKSEIVFIPYEKAYDKGFEDMIRRVPDLSKINKLIGYEPRNSLNDLVKDIIFYEKDKCYNNIT